jgi:hypothetical protein
VFRPGLIRAYARGLFLVGFVWVGVYFYSRSDSPTFAQAPQTITVRPRSVGPNPTIDSPTNANDGSDATSAGKLVSLICKVSCAPSNQTATATWNNVLNGYRPIRLEIHWKAVPTISLFGTATASVKAKLEYDIGQGLQIYEQYEWTQNQLVPNCPNPSNQSIQCGDHVTSISLLPEQSTGAIQVRLTLTDDLLTCNNCIVNTGDPSQARGQIWVYDIRVIAETPTLTIDHSTPTRGDSAVFQVLGAPGSTISGWQYVTMSPNAVGTIGRTSNTNSATWSGKIVASGTGKVSVMLLGQPYNLEKVVTVSPRNWAFPAVDAHQRSQGYVEPCNTIVTNSPILGLGGAGLYDACIRWDLTLADVETISDDGPNHGLKWITGIRDLTTADWVIHPDATDANGDWWKHQCGDFVPGPTSTCAAPTGQGFIKPQDYADGVVRHELGHHSQYVAAQDNPLNNIKTGAENQVGAATQDKVVFFNSVNNLLILRRDAIYAGYHTDGTPNAPCHQQCDATCTIFNGPVNTKPNGGNWIKDPCAP